MEGCFAYCNEKKAFGKVVKLDYLSKRVVIEDEDSVIYECESSTVEILPEIGTLHSLPLTHKDILIDFSNGNFYLLEDMDDGSVEVIELDEDFNKTGNVETVDKNTIEEWGSERFDIYANYYEVIEQHRKERNVLGFNVKPLKIRAGERDMYMYACNNRYEEVIDLIPVLIIGNPDLEQAYERVSIPYAIFMEVYEEYQEVSTEEMADYLHRLLTGQEQPPSQLSIEVDMVEPDKADWDFAQWFTSEWQLDPSEFGILEDEVDNGVDEQEFEDDEEDPFRQ